MTTATAAIEPAPEPTTALALIEKKDVASYFAAKGLDPIIQKIREEATSVVGDISTPKGRDEIRSRAFKVAKTKTALDEMGKKLVSGLKEQTKAIDDERSRAWDEIEAIQKEVRAPLTEWENAEKARVDGHEAAIAAIPEHPGYGQHETAAELTARLAHLENLPPRDWQEFSVRAAKVLADEIDRTKALLAAAEKREAEQAELARLRQEQAEREQREREERIAAEAAAQAKAEAEEAARLAAAEKAERERAAAEARAKKAEEDRLAAAAKAEADRKEAAEKAERDRKAAEEAAAKRERDRIEAEKRQQAEETAKREADKKHRAKINGEALAALVTAGLSEDNARAAVTAIAKGEIPNVKISY